MLRRTPLARGVKPLARRTPLPRTGKRPAAMKTQTRPRNTGPTVAGRALVRDRAGGCCELCGVVLYVEGSGWIAAHSFHHRQPRGMGGSRRPDANAVWVLLLLCGTGTTGCHGRIEIHRSEALARGWLVLQSEDPATKPVHVLSGGSMTPVLLTADGGYDIQDAA